MCSYLPYSCKLLYKIHISNESRNVYIALKFSSFRKKWISQEYSWEISLRERFLLLIIYSLSQAKYHNIRNFIISFLLRLFWLLSKLCHRKCVRVRMFLFFLNNLFHHRIWVIHFVLGKCFCSNFYFGMIL